MISQQQWLHSRKKLLHQVKSEVQLRLGPQSLKLRRYAKNLERELSARWTRCALKDLQKAIRTATVVLGSDFHAYAQSQRSHIRLLRTLNVNRPVILALECLPADFNSEISQFLEGGMSEKEFLTKVEWEKRWGFPWEHFKPLFELAKTKKFQVRGLNSTHLHDLKKRDNWSAREILAMHEQAPNALIYAVIGEWHLAEQHLPRQVRHHLGPSARIVTILQDAEDLYFRLAKNRREDSTECLKRAGHRYCVMVSPPWLKWQSYLMYLEQTYDRDLQDDLDYTDHIIGFIKILERDLKVVVNRSKLHVYSTSSKKTLHRLSGRKDAKLLRAMLEHERSFVLPPTGLLYLSRLTINHAAALSGQFVHAEMARRTRALWSMPEDFLALVWVEAVGFFFSKWINPKRKAEDLESIRLQLQAAEPQDLGRDSLLLALEHQMSVVLWLKSKRLRVLQFKPKQKFSYLEAARIVGSVLGEKLYRNVREGEVSLQVLKEFLLTNVEDSDFSNRYWHIIERLG